MTTTTTSGCRMSSTVNGMQHSPPDVDRGRPPGTNELIVAAALELFAEHSYEGTSMRQIAASVGVKPASLYNHFASKEDILWEIARRSQDQLGEEQGRVFDAVAGTAEALEAFVRMHTAFHARWPLSADITNRQLRSLSADRLAQTVVFRDGYERRLRDLLNKGCEEGVFEISNTRIASYAILEMGMGVSVWFRADGPLSVEQVCDLHAELVARMVGITA